jgi:spermidine synthase
MPIEILFYETTSLGLLCLRRRELLSKPGTMVTEVTLNHEFLMSSYLNESERALSRLGLERISRKTPDTDYKFEVLVGGFGLGYTAAEALSSDQVETVEVVEYLPEVISWLDNDLIPLANQLKSDGRLTVAQGDIYARLAEPAAKRFDLIVIDVDHSPQDLLGSQSKGFYSEWGLSRARLHLKPGGVLGVWSYAEDSPLLNCMSKVFNDVEVEQVTVWNDLINEEMTDWLFFGSRAEN